MYTGALENHPDLVDQMAWIAPLLGNPGDVLARVRSPWELAHALRHAGLLFPETCASAEGLPSDGSWLVKTYHGASGSGVRLWDGERGAGSKEQEGIHSTVYQRRAAGVSCAAVYVAADGAAELLGVTRQLIGQPWLGAHGFQYAGSIGEWPVSDAARLTLERIGNTLAAQFELVGLVGVDFMLDGDEIWTLEVNPRYTASVEIVERCTDVKAIAFHVAACNQSLSIDQRAGSSSTPGGAGDGPARSNAQFHGKAILFAKRDLKISEAIADESLAEALRTPWPTLGDVSSAGTLIESGRPILTVFAEGSTVEEIEQRLRERVAQLEHKLYIDG